MSQIPDKQLVLGVGEFADGSIIEVIDFDITSNGTTVTFALDDGSGGDLTAQIAGERIIFTAASIALTPGTDSAPVLNYVYLIESGGSAILNTSTTSFPAVTGYAPIATIVVQSASGVQTDGVYKSHAWSDHINLSPVGHISHINEKLRQKHADWESGMAGTITIASGPSPDDVFFDVTTGVIYQVHRHNTPALDMDTPSNDPAFVVNDNTTPYLRVTNLNTVLTDSTGTSMSNNYFNLVFWIVGSDKDVDTQIMVNLPSGSYNNSADAQADTNKYSNYSIPVQFRGTGVLVGEYTFRHQTAGGGTWTLEKSTDLRGLIPSTSAGGGAGITAHNSLTGLLADDHTQYNLNIDIQDEAVSLTTRPIKIDFAGAGVTVTEPVTDEVLVTIPGGGGASISVEDEGTPLTTAVTKFNFVGEHVTVTEPVADEMLVTVESAPTLTTGAGDPVSTPGKILDMYDDLTNNVAYIAHGTGGATSWKAATNGPIRIELVGVVVDGDSATTTTSGTITTRSRMILGFDGTDYDPPAGYEEPTIDFYIQVRASVSDPGADYRLRNLTDSTDIVATTNTTSTDTNNVEIHEGLTRSLFPGNDGVIGVQHAKGTGGGGTAYLYGYKFVITYLPKNQ